LQRRDHSLATLVEVPIHLEREHSPNIIPKITDS
jgi:hypothetical protein